MGCIVAIDGPVGAGKGTVAAQVARQCQLAHVDTGAIYRVLAYAAAQAGVCLEDPPAVARLAAQLHVRMHNSIDAVQVWCNDQDVSDLIRTQAIGEAASCIAQHAVVRQALLPLQRKIALSHPRGAVVEGRDMGTVVFPNAHIKVFLTASATQRARRKHAQLLQKGEHVSHESVLQSLQKRDERDTNREIAALAVAPGATTIDSTHLTARQVADQICMDVQNWLAQHATPSHNP
ncbi:MAG: (d)CMP kinase [Myxococcota bacterium]